MKKKVTNDTCKVYSSDRALSDLLGVAVLTIAHANRDLTTMLHELTPTLSQETTFLLRRIEGKHL